MTSNRFYACGVVRPASVCVVSALAFASTLTAAGAARAQVTGRLHFSVKSAETEKPVAGATVTLKDSAGVRPDITLTTDATGGATSATLENRAWRITTEADLFQADSRDVTVVADKTTEVEVLLEPLKEKVVKVTANRTLVRTTSTTSSTQRDQTFLNKYPVTGTNNQSLSKALSSNPGFVEDSANQAHPRGEHGSTSIYINGFLLPGALQGRAGQFLSPDAIQTLDVQTGGYAPEFGGETAAVLNLTLRAGTIKPFVDAQLGGGGYSTFQGVLTAGGQGGASYGAAAGTAGAPKRFGYLLNLTQRQTDNALEPPQPDKQSAHNAQNSSTVFGNFDFHASDRDQFTLTVNASPAQTEIANRTGLPNSFRGRGQGFGFGGAQDAGSTTTLPGGQVVPLLSQQAAGQDIYQTDANNFSVLQYRKQFNTTATGLFSLGYSQSRLDIKNRNPNNSALVNPAALPTDSSIEYSPTVKRDYKQTELQGNVTFTHNPLHTVKIGGLYTDQRGDESYLLVPGSQIALDALYATDPRLAPGGGTAGATLDSNGNPIYQLAGASNTPTLGVSRKGYYAAAFVQDTYKATRKFTVNYGVRGDFYKASQNLGQSAVKTSAFSPRVNTSYVVAPLTVLRLSYNRLFTQPPLAQGAILGSSIKPQTTDLYEQSIERQLGPTQTAKISFYQKYNHNQLDTGLLIPGTQIGVFSAVNFERSRVRGTEVSYDLTPRNNVGAGGFIAYANTTAKPTGVDNLGNPVPTYNDHDQLNTLTVGTSYTLVNGVNGGISYLYGSGTASSIVPDPVTGAGSRQARTEVNLHLASGPRLFKGVGADLAVENLFDSRKVINFNSGFSGTRFQQGRRLLLSLNGRF